MISTRLRKLADEIEETAVGSSRIEMYRSIATELREQAGKVAELEALAKNLKPV